MVFPVTLYTGPKLKPLVTAALFTLRFKQVQHVFFPAFFWVVYDGVYRSWLCSWGIDQLSARN
jgi:F0F1-type ATP synthase assembly protein I